MGQLYDGTYNTGTLFLENRYQKIYMGESVTDSDCVVVISIFNKSDVIDASFIHTLQENLQHLLHFEEDEQTAVFITEYGEGMSLFQAIEQYPNTAHFRMNLLHDYLNSLRRFDALAPTFQFILASDSQFFLKDGELAHSELVIIEEDAFNPGMTFDSVKARIAGFAEKVLTFSPDAADMPIVTTLQGFFSDLGTDMSLVSLEKIYQAYRKIYIYDLYLDRDTSTAASPVIPVVTPVHEPDIPPTDEPMAPPTEMSAPTTPRRKRSLPFSDNKILLFNKERYAVNPLFLALAVIAISLILFAAFLPMLNQIKDTPIPVASFEKEKTDDHWKFQNFSETFGSDNKITQVEWEVYSNDTLYDTYDTHNLNLYFNTEGIYRISLRVMDKFGNWSEPYSEEIYFTPMDLEPLDGEETDTESRDTLDSYSITFEGTPAYDSEEVRTGTKSIRIDFDGDETHGIVLNPFMDNNTRITFWIKALDETPLTVTAVGLNNGDTLFSKSKVVYPKAGQWMEVEFNVDTTYANRLKLYFNGTDTTLWIDDIEVNSYK